MSVSVAAGTAAPTFVPDALFSATLRVRVSLANAGAVLGAAVTATVTEAMDCVAG